MTQAELDALPEDGAFTFLTEIRAGQQVRVPLIKTVGALWTEDDETCAVIDSQGQRWRVGWSGGVRYKRRA